MCARVRCPPCHMDSHGCHLKDGRGRGRGRGQESQVRYELKFRMQPTKLIYIYISYGSAESYISYQLCCFHSCQKVFMIIVYFSDKNPEYRRHWVSWRVWIIAPIPKQKEKYMCHLSPVTSHLSHVTFHLSHVTCHLSHKKKLFFYKKKKYQKKIWTLKNWKIW